MVLLAKDGVVDSDVESPLALILLTESDGGVPPDLRSPLIADVKARRLKSNPTSILLPIYRSRTPCFGFKQVSRIVEAALAIATLFSALQEFGGSGIESNLQVR